MLDHDPTVRSRELGMALLRAIGTAGLNQSDLAEMLGWSPSKVSRMISGKRCASTEDVSAVLAVTGVTGQRRESLLAVAREAHAGTLNWLVEDDDYSPGSMSVLAHLEQDAGELLSVSPFAPPGLLQAESYIRAVSQATSADERVHRIQERQRRLDSEWGGLHFLIAENALVRDDLPDSVVSDQMHHLLRLSVQPHIRIRVVPQRNRSVTCEPFEVLDREDSITVVCVESLTSLSFLARPATVRAYRRVWNDLQVTALDVDHTRAWLREKAEAMGDGLSSGISDPTPIFA
jgi:predicted XRE-type DNA-binding protein